MKRVLSVGQCDPDHSSLVSFLNNRFDVEILRADLAADTFEHLARQSIDLVLINRKLDADYSDGTDLLRAIKSNPSTAHVPVMIVSNFEDAQEAAVAEGAVRGIGKAELHKPEAGDRVAAVLEDGA